MAPGRVFLVGAGPGDPELLTLKAAKVLRSADVVLHDELVSAEILKLIPATAETVNVGKRCGKKSTPQSETNKLLVQHALMGRLVVRLKGGDPFIFGRGGEELEALRAAGVEVEIVPGITAALGAAAGNLIPLTHREIASTLVLITGSSKHSGNTPNWPDRVPTNATVVVYMPGHDFAALQQRLLSAGIAAETPCAIVSGATTQAEQVHITSVAGLSEAPRLVPPRLVIVGEVVGFADQFKQQFNGFQSSNQLVESSAEARESVE
jgi:uroporphyrin-III C-methyltransferase